MNLAIILLSVLAAAPKVDFDGQKARANELQRPEKALAAIVGNCHQQDPEMQIQCQENVKLARKKYLGKAFYIDLGANHQDMLQFEGVHHGQGRFLWVPMYDAGRGIALTTVKPRKLNKQGWPILKKLVINGPMPSATMASDLRRAAMLGQVNIELVGRFARPWTLRHKGKAVQGVVFKASAIRFSQARSGKVIFDAKLRGR